MKLVTPTRVLSMLLAQQFDQPGTQRGMLPVIGADFTFERFDRAGFGAEGLVKPAFQSRSPEDNRFPRNGVSPFLGSQFLELCLELASGGRRSQKRSNNAEAKMRPALMVPQG